MQRIIPNLWFDTQAEEAVAFYTSTFKKSRTGFIARYGEEGAKVSGMPEGSVMTIEFQIEGYRLIALNGGPVFKFTPAVSFFVWCKTREEIDGLWIKLVDGGSVLMELEKYPFAERYGWLQDRFGLSWQFILGDQAQEITPCLLYVGKHAGQAEDAMKLYTATLPNSKIDMISRYEEGGPDPAGTVSYGAFTLAGQSFVAMDSAISHQFTFTEAISLMMECRDQEEIDHFWTRLTEGGEEEPCGWLRDRYGVSWQIVPAGMNDILQDPNPAKRERVMRAFFQMKKIDIAALKRAAEGE